MDSFEITCPQAEVQVVAGGVLEVVFTVSSSLDRDADVYLKVSPEQAPWIDVKGESVASIPAAGTLSVTVLVAPPEGTKGAAVPFRLEASSTATPERHTAQSREVRVTVAEVRPFPWKWVFAGLAAVLVAGGVVAWFVLQPPGLGEACDDGGRCGGQLTCHLGKCLLTDGSEGCRADEDCTSATCRAGVCRPRPAELGQVCAPDRPCVSALTCHSKTCRLPEGALGCTANRDCATEACDNGTCAPRPGELGEACSTRRPCVSNLTCHAGSCRLGEGASGCANHDHCTSGRCVGGKCEVLPGGLGAACSAVKLCRQGLICHERSCRLADGASGCSVNEHCTSMICRGGKCIEKSRDQIIQMLERASNDAQRQPVQWRSIVTRTIRDLPTNSSVSREVRPALESMIGSGGEAESACGKGFVGARVRESLQSLATQLRGQGAGSRTPRVDKTAPSDKLDMGARPPLFVFCGANLDVDGLQFFFRAGGQDTSLQPWTRARARFHASIDVSSSSGINDVICDVEGPRFIALRRQSRDLHTVPLVRKVCPSDPPAAPRNLHFTYTHAWGVKPEHDTYTNVIHGGACSAGHQLAECKAYQGPGGEAGCIAWPLSPDTPADCRCNLRIQGTSGQDVNCNIEIYEARPVSPCTCR